MKRFSQVAFLVFVLFFAACGKYVPVHRSDIPITKEQLKKTKDYYFKEIEKLKKETDKKEFQVLQKRKRGYNTSDSELKIKEARDLLRKLFDDVLREKFEEIDEEDNKTTISNGLKAVEQKLKKAVELLKSAPEFGEKAKKEKGLFVKINYSGDQAAVYQIMGEPDRKITGPHGSIRLRINGRLIQLNYPPQAEIWIYKRGNEAWAIIFVYQGVASLGQSQNLNENLRDSVLQKYIAFPAIIKETFVQISTIDILRGDYPSSAEEVITYLFTRQGMRIPLGFSSAFENAKSSAALPNLDFVSMVFNTKLFSMTNIQQEKLEEVKSLLIESQSGFKTFFNDFEEEMGKIIESDLQKDIASFEKENFRLPADNELEEIESNVKKSHFEEIKKAREKIYRKLSKTTRKIVDSFDEIAKWQSTFNPKKKHIEELFKLVDKDSRVKTEAEIKKFKEEKLRNPSKEELQIIKQKYADETENIKTVCNEFADAIKELRDEFEIVGDKLRKYDKFLPKEARFGKDDLITIFFLNQGVRYLPVMLKSGLEVDEPNLVLIVKIRYKISREIIEQLKLDPEKYVSEYEIKIEQANRIFKEYRDAQRLTSFGIFFPFKLGIGKYEIRFELTDKNRENMIAIHTTSWTIE